MPHCSLGSGLFGQFKNSLKSDRMFPSASKISAQACLAFETAKRLMLSQAAAGLGRCSWPISSKSRICFTRAKNSYFNSSISVKLNNAL